MWKAAQTKGKNKKLIKFIRDTYNEASDDDDHTLAKFGFYNVGYHHESFIRIMLHI